MKLGSLRHQLPSYFFVTNHPQSIITADTTYVDISDQLPVFMFVENKTVREKKKYHVYQDISGQNLTKFRETTERLTWESVYKEGDCNKAYETFLSELSNISYLNYQTGTPP